MGRFATILLPLDGSPEAAKGAGCALWLARTLGATLHVVHATPTVLATDQARARLHLPDAAGVPLVLHQVGGTAEAAVLGAIAAHHIDLIVLSARGESASSGINLQQRLGSVASAVIEHSAIPVLLLPLHYRDSLPWTSMLAAASGEGAADSALEAAAALAAALHLEVNVVHCEDGPAGPGAATLGTYPDAPHHEYPRRLEEIVERGLVGSSLDACQCVHQVLLCRGEPATALLEQITLQGSSVLALGWHGTLVAGRAMVLKRLLEDAACALLLVRREERATAHLRIGDEIDD